MNMAAKRVSRGFARVRLEGKDYLISSNRPHQLMRITDHPSTPSKLLVWRLEKGPSHFNMYVNEAVKAKNRLKEEHEVASLESKIKEKQAFVQDFEVDPGLFGKTLRVAMREALVRELRKRNVEEMSFPPYRFPKFYTAAGITEEKPPFVGYTGKLSEYKPKARKIALKVVWQRPVPEAKRKAKGGRLRKPMRAAIDGFV